MTRKWLQVSSVLLLSVGLAAPASAKKKPPQYPGTPEMYAPFDSSGTGRIAGRAFGTTEGGEVKIMAGRTIYLEPATLHALELVHDFETRTPGALEMTGWKTAPQSPFANADSLTLSYERRTESDADGAFIFGHLASRATPDSSGGGQYIVWTRITWKILRAHMLDSDETGGFAYRLASVAPGRTTKVSLNQNPSHDLVLPADDEEAEKAH